MISLVTGNPDTSKMPISYAQHVNNLQLLISNSA